MYILLYIKIKMNNILHSLHFCIGIYVQSHDILNVQHKKNISALHILTYTISNAQCVLNYIECIILHNSIIISMYIYYKQFLKK